MGSVAFGTSVYAPTAEAGYATLVTEAEFYHGHDSYNGTISTTYGFKMLPFEEDESSREWFDHALDGVGKRDCVCVEAAHIEKNGKGWPLWHFAGYAAE